MKRSVFTGVVSVLLLASLLFACSSTSRSLQIASHIWPGYELVFLAQREGWLPEDQVRLVETRSATDSIEALKAGTVDGAMLTLDEVLRARDEGVDLQVVLVVDESAGADALLVRPGIDTLADLAGKRIGVEETAVGELMLNAMLKQAGLTRDNVSIVSVTSDLHATYWAAGRLDAVVTYEPIVAELERQGGRNVFDSRQLPDMIFDVLAIRSDVINQYDESVYTLVMAHFTALDHLRQNPQDAAYRMAGHLGVDGHEVLRLYGGLELSSIASNRVYLSKGGIITQTANKLSTVMQAAGTLSGEVDLVNLTHDEFLPHPEH